MEKNNKNLYYLHELSDYKVADGDPDVRGWKVNDIEQRCLGKVDNLIVNKNTQRVVYLDVEVDPSIIAANHSPYGTPAIEGVHEFLNKEGDNHLIIPIGLVTLDKDSEKVHTDSINHRTFAETKRTAKNEAISRDYELIILKSYNQSSETYPEGEQLYDRAEFRHRGKE